MRRPASVIPGPVPVLASALGVLLAATSLAGPADVLDAKAHCRPAPGNRPASVCKFVVTVRHADTGWDHYANYFEILAPDGERIVQRVLRHPHVEEQPFTRSTGPLRIPHEIETVTVRAGDLLHGLSGASLEIEVPHPRPGDAAGEGPAAEKP